MHNKLIDLADYLDCDGFEKEADTVDSLVKLSARPAPQKVKEYQNPSDMRPLLFLIKSLGLVPGVDNGASLVNASLYLTEGVSSSNLLLSALSIASMVPGMEDVDKFIKYGSTLDSETTLKLVRLIMDNKEKIKFSFDRLKDKKIIPYMKKYIPQGNLLPMYSDRMFEEMRKWAYDIINTGVKEKSSQPSTDAEAQLNQVAADLL
jgi:hypothetical protein